MKVPAAGLGLPKTAKKEKMLRHAIRMSLSAQRSSLKGMRFETGKG